MGFGIVFQSAEEGEDYNKVGTHGDFQVLVI